MEIRGDVDGKVLLMVMKVCSQLFVGRDLFC